MQQSGITFNCIFSHHPNILSKEDILTRIDSAANLKIKTAIELFYAFPVFELKHVHYSNVIDKSKKNDHSNRSGEEGYRIAVLSHTALEIMGAASWRELHPEVYLFVGYKKNHYHNGTLILICVRLAPKAGNNTQVTTWKSKKRSFKPEDRDGNSFLPPGVLKNI